MLRATLAILFQICSLPYLLVFIVMVVAIHSVESIPVNAKSSYSIHSPNAQTKEWDNYQSITREQSFQSSIASDNSLVPSSLEDPHLFSNFVLSYDKQKDQAEKSANLKTWLSKKFSKFINPEKNKEEEEEEMTEEEIVPRSSNPNEVFLPIDFNLLIPSNAGNSSNSMLNLSKLSLNDSTMVDEKDDEHVFESEQVSSGEQLLRSETGKVNDFEDFHHNSLDFVQQLIRHDDKTPAEVTTSVPLVATTTNNVNGRPSSSTTIDYRNISYDLPERRFLMTYPIRRLLMAYFAPRILRFQMAMLVNSVIGEVSRKIFDPLIGNRFGFGNSGVSQPATTAPPPSSSTLSLTHLAQSLSSLSSLPSLASLASNGMLPSLPSATVPKAAAQMQSAPQANHQYPMVSQNSPAPSTPSSLSTVLSSALSGLPGGLNLNPQAIQSLLGSLGDSDIKQIMSMANLGQANGNFQSTSNVDYEDDSRETETSSAHLTPT